MFTFGQSCTGLSFRVLIKANFNKKQTKLNILLQSQTGHTVIKTLRLHSHTMTFPAAAAITCGSWKPDVTQT